MKSAPQAKKPSNNGAALAPPQAQKLPANLLFPPQVEEGPHFGLGAPAAAGTTFGHRFDNIPVNASVPEESAYWSRMEAGTCPLATPRTCPFGGACHTCPLPVQAKVAISQPGDVYEQEADRVAEEVLRMPEEQVLQRKCLPCGEDEDEDEVLQTKEVPGSTPAVGSLAGVPPLVHEVIRSPGQPLDPATRAFMEPRFGHDFSQVRVHTDEKAHESAQAANALAYTVANKMVFRQGQYAPGTIAGKRLLAHELAHVIKQRSQVNGLQRQASPAPASESVWGLEITRRMCGCRQDIRDAIEWANTARETYASCDIPANATGADVETCFEAAHPGTVVVGETSSSGVMTLPPPSADPCQRIANKATFVHETMHARHANSIARSLGWAFYGEWRRLAGDPNRLDTLRSSFPAEVAAFETQWNNGHDWAQDEVNAYRWERRFLTDALRALNRICV